MRKSGALLLLWLALCSVAFAATPKLDHVVIVALENKTYSQVVGNPVMPYLNSLIQQYGLATKFYANKPGSVPDYFLLTTGQTISLTPSIPTPVTANNIVRALTAQGKSWKSYAQSIPKAGYLGPSVYPYIKYHNPFAYFSDVIKSPAQAAKIVPLSQLAADAASDNLPNYMFIVPDNEHNAHDCPGGQNVSCTADDRLHAADLFLQNHLPALLNTSSFQDNGLLVIWWDEGSEDGGDEHVAITLVGSVVKKNFRSGVFYQHQHLLRTVVEGLQLGSYPGSSLTASSMSDFFSVPAAPLLFEVTSSPTTQTVAAGKSATYTISIKTLNGTFDSIPALTCGGLPAAAGCSFSTPAKSAANTTLTSTLTVTTTARTAASLHPAPRKLFAALILPLIGLATLRFSSPLPGRRRACRRVWRVASRSLLLIMLAAMLASCAGLAASNNTGQVPPGSIDAGNGTPAGTFNLQVNASTAASTDSTNVTLIIQ